MNQTPFLAESKKGSIADIYGGKAHPIMNYTAY